MRNVEVVSFGCRLNTYESEVIRSRALEAGLNDAVIFNTCAVTAEAMRQARQAIRHLRQEHPASRVIVTGCGAQIDPAMFARMPEVDAVMAQATRAGATIVKPAGATFWGGYAGYFADPDGHLWEVVYNPQLLPEDVD